MAKGLRVKGLKGVRAFARARYESETWFQQFVIRNS